MCTVGLHVQRATPILGTSALCCYSYMVYMYREQAPANRTISLKVISPQGKRWRATYIIYYYTRLNCSVVVQLQTYVYNSCTRQAILLLETVNIQHFFQTGTWPLYTKQFMRQTAPAKLASGISQLLCRASRQQYRIFTFCPFF